MRRISHFNLNLNAYTGLLAVLAGLIALAISFPFAAAYFRAYGSGEPMPPWLSVFARAFPDLLNFTFPRRVYQIFGRVYSLVIPLTVPGLFVLKERVGIGTQLSQRGWWTFFGGLLLFGIGVAGDYWPDQDSSWVGMGFMFELAGTLVFWVGAVLYGVAARRAGRVPHWIGSGLIGIAPGGILGMVLLAHIPSGPLYGYVIFMLIFGLTLAYNRPPLRPARLFAISGGLIWISFHLYYIFSGIDSLELGVSILLAGLSVFLMGLAVLSLMRGPHLGTGGRTGAVILLGGMAPFFLGATLAGLGLWDNAWLLAIGGEALTTLGLVAFSLGILAEGARVLWKWLPLFLAPVYLLSFSTTSSSFPPWVPPYTPEWLAVFYGVGWNLLGFLLPRSEEESYE